MATKLIQKYSVLCFGEIIGTLCMYLVRFVRLLNIKYWSSITTLSEMLVHTALYGSIARYANGRFVAEAQVPLEEGSRVSDLLKALKIPDEERGYLFVNAVLCEVPGLSTGSGEELHDRDHVGIFSSDYMWPYQYRDGVPMSESLIKALQARGSMHHTYP
jgi:hypothetical protein